MTYVHEETEAKQYEDGKGNRECMFTESQWRIQDLKGVEETTS